MMSDTLQFSQFIVCNPWPRVCPAQYPDFVAIRGSKCIQHQSCIKEETWETLFICLFKSTKFSNDEKGGWMLSLQKRFKWTQIKMLYISGLQISLWIRHFSKFLKILYFSKIIFSDCVDRGNKCREDARCNASQWEANWEENAARCGRGCVIIRIWEQVIRIWELVIRWSDAHDNAAKKERLQDSKVKFHLVQAIDMSAPL